jgi:CHAD domain-containing protein
MSRDRQSAAFRLTDRFDLSRLVGALKHAGWAVRRSRPATADCSILDTGRREISSVGLVPVEERSGRRRALSVWLIPRKRNEIPAIVFSSARSAALPALLASETSLHIEGEITAVARFRRETIPFSLSSRAGKLSLKIEALFPDCKEPAPIRSLRLEAHGPAARASDLLALVGGLVRLQKGVSDEAPDGPWEILRACGLAVGPSLEDVFHCQRGDSAADVAVAILARNFANLLAEEPGARLALDPEYVHNMRVATRRMRAALRMFRKAFLKEDRARLNAELRWLAKALGAVRDADVYIDAVPAFLSYIDWTALDFAFYIRELETRRRAAQRDLLAALDSPRYAALKARIESFIAEPRFSDARIDLRDVAAAGLERFSQEVLQTGDSVRTEEDLHALRIAMKRLRYAVESLRGLAPKRLARLSEIATGYQDILGAFTDATVACSRVREAVNDTARDRTETFMLGYLLACQRLAAIDARDQFLRKWRGRGVKRLAKAVDSALAKIRA